MWIVIFFSFPRKFGKIDCLFWTKRYTSHALAALMEKSWFAIFEADIMAGTDPGAQAAGNAVISDRKVFIV
jgi:hypothetical protein